MSMLNKNKTTHDDDEQEPTNPLLPAGYDTEGGPFFVHPDLRPYWGLDQDEEHALLADDRRFRFWVWQDHMHTEYQRRVTTDGWPAGLTDRQYEDRLERDGFKAPEPTRADRPAYAHAVRQTFAVQRLGYARRAEENRARDAESRWCELGRHSHPTTSRRRIRGVWVKGCADCATRTESLVVRLVGVQAGEDEVSQADWNNAWVTGHQAELLAENRGVELGRTIAAARAAGLASGVRR